ncbi:MAG: peptidoglycan editing factor PgeF [Terriglobia bacterium]
MKGSRRSRRGVPLLTAARLGRYAWLLHGFTARQPGELNLTYSVGQALAAVTRNRRALLGSLPSPAAAERWQLVTLRQRHSDIIQVIHRTPPGKTLVGSSGGRFLRERDGAVKLAGDALVTNQPGLLLAVQVADCLPILLVDPRKRVVAAVHSGWRGTVKRITEKAVGRMRQEFGCEARTMLAAIGPGIHRCCYPVGREVAETFASQFPYWKNVIRRTQPSPTEVHWQQPVFAPAPGAPRPRPAVTPPPGEKFHLDLVEANRRQLRAAGLRAGNVWASPLCTACRTDLFFSHRAEQGRTGRMMGLVGLVNRQCH